MIRSRTGMASIIVLIILALDSCGGGKIFDMVRKGDQIVPGTIAVVAGKEKDQDYMLALQLTNYMSKVPGYKVVSQDELSEKIFDYPYINILGEWGNPPANKNNEAWFSPENRASVNTVQKAIKTQYIYVIWTDQLTLVTSNQGGTSYSIVVYGRLLAYPEGEVIGYTVKRFSKSSGCFDPMSLIRTVNQDINKMLEETAATIASDIKKYSKK